MSLPAATRWSRAICTMHSWIWLMLVLKHIRNWSYGVLEREVRAKLLYRDFAPGC
jgi:hypothetical protein